MRPGSTLIEVLAVTILLALAAGAVVGSSLGRAPSSESPVTREQALEDGLRTRAQHVGGLELTWGDNGWQAADRLGRRLDLPELAHVGSQRWCNARGAALRRFSYDANGFSIDFLVTIPDMPPRLVDGLSGTIGSTP